jgi:MmyB-like transcription regulator ligand binding domain
LGPRDGFAGDSLPGAAISLTSRLRKSHGRVLGSDAGEQQDPPCTAFFRVAKSKRSPRERDLFAPVEGGAATLTEFLLGPSPAEPHSEPVNLAVAMMSAEGVRPFITNWEEVAHYLLRGVQADAQTDGAPETLALLNRLLALPDVAALSEGPPPTDSPVPVLPIHFRKGETSLRLFTTIATLGTPRDITLQEIRVECFFPMDDVTARLFRDWANG